MKPLVESGVTKYAVLSPDKQYRYVLERWWGSGDPVVFIMLNPSTADHREDDPTIRRCINYADGWGRTGLIVVNLFALRATQPKVLTEVNRYEAIGPDNDDHIEKALARTDLVICAWGRDGALYGRAAEVCKRFSDQRWKCLAMNKDRSPAHPLYQKGGLTPLDFPYRGQ